MRRFMRATAKYLCLCSISICIGVVSLCTAVRIVEKSSLEEIDKVTTHSSLLLRSMAANIHVDQNSLPVENQEVTSPSGAGPMQPMRVLSALLAQWWGTRCVTPRGVCGLSSPQPINAPCCCPFACGFVAP
jgi:hypothetical protein